MDWVKQGVWNPKEIQSPSTVHRIWWIQLLKVYRRDSNLERWDYWCNLMMIHWWGGRGCMISFMGTPAHYQVETTTAMTSVTVILMLKWKINFNKIEPVRNIKQKEKKLSLPLCYPLVSLYLFHRKTLKLTRKKRYKICHGGSWRTRRWWWWTPRWLRWRLTMMPSWMAPIINFFAYSESSLLPLL